MNKPIAAACAPLSCLPAELRDAVFCQAPTLADAHRFNAALGEGRDPSVWQRLTQTHLPHVVNLLTRPAQKMLAAQVQACPTLDYSACEGVWDEVDVETLTKAAVTRADTPEAQALKPTLLREVLARYSKQLDDVYGQEHQSPEHLRMLELYYQLDNSIWQGDLPPKLTLYLDPHIKKLPELMAGFDHVEHLVLLGVPDDVDLSVLARMPALKSITLQYFPGARIELPKELKGKDITLDHANART